MSCDVVPVLYSSVRPVRRRLRKPVAEACTVQRMIDEHFKADTSAMSRAIRGSLEKKPEGSPLISKHVQSGGDRPGRFRKAVVHYMDGRKSDINVWCPDFKRHPIKQGGHHSSED